MDASNQGQNYNAGVDQVEVKAGRYIVWEKERIGRQQETTKNASLIAGYLKDDARELLNLVNNEEVHDIVDNIIYIAAYIEAHFTK